MMPNHPTVNTLVTLARADLAIVHAQKKMKALKAKTVSLSNDRKKADKRLIDAENALIDLKRNEINYQQKIETYIKRTKTAVQALEKGLGDPDSAQKQITQCGDIIDNLEISILENLDAQESAATAILMAKESVVEHTDKTTVFQTESRIQSLELGELVSAKTAARTQLIKGLDVTIRNRYENLRRSKGTAVARVVDSCCRTCQLALPMQDVSDLQRGREISCRKCGRWLFIAER